MQPILEGLESNGSRSQLYDSGQLLDYDIRHQIYSRNSRTATIARRKPLAYGQVLLSQNHSTRWQTPLQDNSSLSREQYTYGANFNTNFNAEFDPANRASHVEPPKSDDKKSKEHSNTPKPSVPRRVGKTLPYRFLYRMRPSMRRHMGRNGEMQYMPPSNLIRLFGESSVPGVRDIALSRSFLRRVFWICSFFFFGFLALRDISQLVSEYYTYPITVDVRLRDSRRLQFPAVTVCNMNIVRYSALCVANLSVIKDSMIPRDLREKLCGIQPGAAVSASAVTPPSVLTTTLFSSVPETSSTQHIKQVTKPSKKKTSTSSTTSRTKTSSTVTTTTPATDSNDGLDDINNYGVISKDNKNKTLLGNETNANSNSTSLKGIDFESDENGTSSLPPQSTTVTMSSKLDDIPNDIAAPITELDTPLSRPKRKVKPTGSGRAFENGTYFNASLGSSGESSGLPKQPSAKGSENSANSAKDSTSSFIDNGELELTEREEKELQENLTNWLAVIYNSNEKIAKELGHQFEDFVLRCTIRSTNCTHANSFEQFFTPTEGNCFTFKSQKLRKTYLERIKDETSIAGVNYGLELVLNLEISEYLTGTAQIGAIIMIQHPDEIGNSASEAIFVAPQQSTYIGLKMVNISRLPKPYPEECIDHWPAALIGRLTQNASYSQQACLKICLQRTIHTRCDCQSAMLPQLELNSTLKICDTRRRNTRNCVEEVMFQAEEKVSTCKCPPRCQVVNYDKTVSMTRWPTREDKVTFDRGKTNINFQNLAKVTVYFQTMTCQEVRQEKAYTTAKLFSSLGGILGMYVGFSFLSLFEILEIFVRRFWYLVTKKKSRFRAAVHTITATLALNQKRPNPNIGYFNKSSRRSRLNASQSLVAARQLGRLTPLPPLGPL